MKIELITKDLLQKLSFLNHAVSSKSQLPILLNLLLEAKDKRLKLTSTDLEIGIETRISATITQEGGITVPARSFTELMNSLSDNSITLQTAQNSLEVISKKTKSTFQTIAATEFPKLYEERGELIAVMEDETLKNAFNRVVFSASADTTRPALSGVLLRPEAEGFLLVATDGFRLSLKHHKVEGVKAKEERSFIVPARVFRELMSIKEEKREIEMYTAPNTNQILFRQGDTLLIGRLIEAEFPNFEKIIPSDFSLSVSFEREELLSAVKICSIFARDSANIVKLAIQKDRITVSSSSPSLGSNTVDVSAKLTGEENEIAFNAKYLLDLLSALPDEEMVFDMIGPLNPGVFKIKDDASFLHLIMPIRTGQ